jgi:NAD(P)-dependent dehydrogenase (short-subunit alcohol dehydrogenase family)
MERQLATSLIGPMNVTRGVLPIMRKQRSGNVISISSGAGLMGFEFNSAYCAAKFGLEGWTEALQPEVTPFGIHTTIVNPGFFRTELLTQARGKRYAQGSSRARYERQVAGQYRRLERCLHADARSPWDLDDSASISAPTVPPRSFAADSRFNKFWIE